MAPIAEIKVLPAITGTTTHPAALLRTPNAENRWGPWTRITLDQARQAKLIGWTWVGETKHRLTNMDGM